MIIWIAINNPPKLTLMSQYQPIFWVSEIKEPINFLLLVLLQLRKQSFAKQTRVFVPPILIIIHHDWIEIQHLWYVRVQSILIVCKSDTAGILKMWFSVKNFTEKLRLFYHFNGSKIGSIHTSTACLLKKTYSFVYLYT